MAAQPEGHDFITEGKADKYGDELTVVTTVLCICVSKHGTVQTKSFFRISQL